MESLKLVGLEDRSHHFPNQLSGGQQQRVAIARALINNPSILLADEPTGNLDTRTSIEVMDVFQKLNPERGITVLLITHEHDIAEYGTRVVAFRDGVIKSDEKIGEAPHGVGGTRRAAARRRVGNAEVSRVTHVDIHDLPDRHQGAQPEQDADRAHDAGHDHRRRRRDHDGGPRQRRAQSIEQQIASAGTNVIMVNAGNFTSGGVRQGQGMSNTLMPDDATAIRNEVPGVQYVAAGVDQRGPGRRRATRTGTAASQGTDVDLPLIRSWPVGQGGFFTPADVTSAAKVCVIGTTVRDMLFGDDADPVGQVIRIRNQPFKIVGVMRQQGPVGDGAGPGRRDLRALHHGAEEVPRHHLHPEHHGVGGFRRRRSEGRRRDRGSCCAPATRSSRATATTSWCARSRTSPRCARRRPGR